MSAEFVHTHVHSRSSLLDATITPEALARNAAEKGMKSLAITEHGNVYSWVHFAKACNKHGVKPIFGVEAYVARRSALEKMSKFDGNATDHLVLLAKNDVGYRNILKLVTLSNEARHFHYQPRIDLNLLAEHSEGIIAQSACLSGAIQRLGIGWKARNPKTKQVEIIPADYEGARAYAGQLKDIFGNNFFLEIQHHAGQYQDAELVDLQRRVIDVNFQLARDLGVPLIATNDIHFERPEHAAARELAFLIGRGKAQGATAEDVSHAGELYFKSSDEMYQAFKILHDYQDPLKNTLWVAEQCNVEMKMGEHNFANPIVNGQELTGDALFATWAHLLKEGLKWRYGSNPSQEVIDRLNYEKKIIEDMGFIPYFVMTWDFVNYARENDIPVGPGRGSAGGCLIAFILGIHDTDPIRYGLLFERFLNPERISLPDIDIDFCKDRVGEVIGHLASKYGEDRVARIATFGNIWAKSAIRETGKILEIDPVRINELSGMVGESAGEYRMDLKRAVEEIDDIKKLAESSDPKERKLIELAQGLEGVSRSVSTHACGVVVGDKPLTEYTALMPVKKDRIGSLRQSQFDMNSLEDVGLMKIDTLALDTLTIIKRSSDLIRIRNPEWNVDLDLERTDEATWDLICSGRAMGLFQVETGGMRKLLMRVQPRSIGELSDVCALYRPGPLDMKIDGKTMVDRYVERKAGLEEPVPPHPLLEEILKDTYGVIVYQEQIMKAAQKLCGWSLGRADFLRKAIGKKKKEMIEEQRNEFIPAAIAHSQITEKEAADIWDMIEAFGRYGFNLAHSTSYALLSYFTGKCKIHYPYEFMCASITSACGWVPPESGLEQRSRNDVKVVKYLDECNRMGIEVRPPDIRNSLDECTLVYGDNGIPVAIQAGFCLVKGIGEAGKRVVMARNTSGSFDSYRSMIKSLIAHSVNAGACDVLIRSGCCDHVGERNQMIAALAVEAQSTRQEVKKFGTGIPDLIQVETVLPEVTPMDPELKQAYNIEHLGTYNITLQPNRITIATNSLDSLEKVVDLIRRFGGGEKGTPVIARLFRNGKQIDFSLGNSSPRIVPEIRKLGVSVKEG